MQGKGKAQLGKWKINQKGTQWDHIWMSSEVLVAVGHPSGNVKKGDLCVHLEVKGEVWPGDAELRVVSL